MPGHDFRNVNPADRAGRSPAVSITVRVVWAEPAVAEDVVRSIASQFKKVPFHVDCLSGQALRRMARASSRSCAFNTLF